MPAVSVLPTTQNGAERLLDAACELFSERGYDGTSIRDIVRLAGTNLNSVNYYFGGKQGLYAAVLRRERARAESDVRTQLPPVDSRADAAQRLRKLVEHLLRLFLDQQSRLPRLAALEIVNPSPAFAELVPELHAREQAELTEVITLLLDAGSRDGQRVQRCVRSVLSQCAWYMFMGPSLARLPGAQPLDSAGIRRLAAHITEFSLHALAGMRRAGG